MAKTTPAARAPLRSHLEALAAFEPRGTPVVSLYLNLAPDQRGRDNYDSFVRKVFAEHLKTFKETSAERSSLERDRERINRYLRDEIDRSANGLALFASGGEFFHAVQLDAPLPEHWFFLAPVPQLYPLVCLVDQYPRYAAVLLDTHVARILVFGLGAIERREQVESEKTRRTAMGGWSQARYQRHADNMHLHHVKEVVDVLDRVVRQENISQILVAGDEVAVPLLREQLPKHLNEKVVDVMSFQRDAGDDEIVQATLEILRQKDAETDAEAVEALKGAWRGGGLAVVGPEETLRALQIGQVDELLITGTPQKLRPTPVPRDEQSGDVIVETSSPAGADPERWKVAQQLVARAEQTGARVRIIEDPSLLADVGGVGALLRFKVSPPPSQSAGPA